IALPFGGSHNQSRAYVTCPVSRPANSLICWGAAATPIAPLVIGSRPKRVANLAIIFACALAIATQGAARCAPVALVVSQTKSGFAISRVARLWIAHAVAKAASKKLSR